MCHPSLKEEKKTIHLHVPSQSQKPNRQVDSSPFLFVLAKKHVIRMIYTETRPRVSRRRNANWQIERLETYILDDDHNTPELIFNYAEGYFHGANIFCVSQSCLLFRDNFAPAR
ncbi:hypothetical protein TNCT_122271 [Trichonephila clavata]|uniref:Uncharacterized protein n=1 Tax=Trichonephila clavata TaxID=2740835 RepID=A0A8X6K0S9_TRICU|nr:hypothetical protein TNCT_122271 [Trichonephila clavata]